MALEQISVVTKEQYIDAPEIPINKKLTFGDVNDIVTKTKLAITQVNENTTQIALLDGGSVVDPTYDLFTDFIAESINYLTGEFIASSSWARTDYISVVSGDKFTYTGVTTQGSPIMLYDSSKVFISASSLTFGEYTDEPFTVPDGVGYIMGLSRNITGDVFNMFQVADSVGLTVGDFEVSLKELYPSGDIPFFESDAGYEMHKPKNDNSAPRVYLSPNGTTNGLTAKFEMFGTDFATGSPNYNGLNILVYNDVIHFGSNKAGTESNQRVLIGARYQASAIISTSPHIEFDSSNNMLFNNVPTYTDNASAVSAGKPTDSVYKTSSGELRIVV